MVLSVSKYPSSASFWMIDSASLTSYVIHVGIYKGGNIKLAGTKVKIFPELAVMSVSLGVKWMIVNK